jgi:predicted transcriptional regulator
MKKEVLKMETLKQEAIKAISKLPESANIDDIMYELYVIDKVKKGREAAERGESISIEDLKREIQSW